MLFYYESPRAANLLSYIGNAACYVFSLVSLGLRRMKNTFNTEYALGAERTNAWCENLKPSHSG